MCLLGSNALLPEHRDLCISIVNTTASPIAVAVVEWPGNLHDVELLPVLEQGNSQEEQCQHQGTQLSFVQHSHQHVTIVNSLLPQLLQNY